MLAHELMAVVDAGALDYARYVTSNRHFVDFRDGLKPVNRCSIWALREENSTPEKAFLKTLQISGMVTGLYHPHNSEAVSEAIALLTQTRAPCAPIEGEGNFGSYKDPPANPKYTTIRLNKYGMTFVDPEYIPHVPSRSNYTGTKSFPLYLPALLPNLLLNGGGGIGYGLSFSAPPFTRKSVAALMRKAINNNGDVTIRDCKKLELYSRYPVEFDGSELATFYETGRSTFRVRPEISMTSDRTIIVNGFDPNISYQPFIRACNDHPDVISVENMSDEKIHIVIKARRGTHDDIIKMVRQQLTVSYGLSNILLRYLSMEEGDTDDVIPFKWDLYTVPAFVKLWIDYRLDLEKKTLRGRIEKLDYDIEKISVLIAARNKIDAVVALLKRRIKTPELLQELCSLLPCQPEHARMLLETPLRQLSHSDILKLRERQSNLQGLRNQHAGNLKNPVPYLDQVMTEAFKNI